MTKDIFNKNTVNESVLKNLGIACKKNIMGSNDLRVIELFKVANRDLTITELVIGYYNKYTEPLNENTKDRNYMNVLLFRLVKKGIVKQIGRGTYRLTIENK